MGNQFCVAEKKIGEPGGSPIWLNGKVKLERETQRELTESAFVVVAAGGRVAKTALFFDHVGRSCTLSRCSKVAGINVEVMLVEYVESPPRGKSGQNAR